MLIQEARRHRALLAILTLYLLLGAVYSVVDPVFEASDELNHYPFVQRLALGQGLPVQRAGEQTLWGQEGSQPPLYYALAAGLTWWIDTGDLPQLLYLNPHANRGVPGAHDNKNMIVHTAREDFPWHGTVLAVHLIRFFSLLLGAGTVLCTYLIARSLFPAQPLLAAAAAAVNAFIPMFLFISASVNNDNLVIFLSALALLGLVRLALRPSAVVSPWRLAALGVVLGLASLSKLSALGLLPLAAGALAWPNLEALRAEAPAGRRSAFGRHLRAYLAGCVALFLPVVVVAGWWYVRNWQLYGDPTGLNAMLAVAGRRKVAVDLVGLFGEFQGFRINFWGLFGGVNVLMRPLWVYRALDGLTLLAAAGLALGLARAWRRREPGRPWPALLLLLGWILVEMASLIRWTTATAASQGRLLFPALPALALFFVLGIASWLPARYRRYGLGALAALLFVLAAAAPFTAIRPAYARPALLASGGIPATAHPIDLDFGGLVRLVAYDVDRETVRPGGTLGVTLYWQALAPVPEDLSLSLSLLSARKSAIGGRDTYPGGGAYPTRLWQPGQVVADHYILDVDGRAIGPTPAWLLASVYRLATLEPLPIRDGRGALVEFPALTTVRVETEQRTLLPSHPLDANLAGKVRLIGYDLPTPRPEPEQPLPIDLYWDVQGRLDRDYKVFIQVLGPDGNLAGQGDAPPLGGFYPTSLWTPGEILTDGHEVRMGETLPPGAYRVIAGLYDEKTGERLELLDAQGHPAGNQVEVATLTVAAH